MANNVRFNAGLPGVFRYGLLAGRVNEMNRLKLDIYKEANANGGIYEKLLGIEA